MEEVPDETVVSEEVTGETSDVPTQEEDDSDAEADEEGEE